MKMRKKVLMALSIMAAVWVTSVQVYAQALGYEHATLSAQQKKDCIAIVKVENFSESLSNAGSFIGNFMPTMNAESLPGVVGLKLLKNPKLVGVKTDAVQCLFVLNPKRYWDVAVVLSISDQEAYLNALGETLKKLGTAGDIHVFGESEFAPKPNVLYYVSFSGGYAIFSKDQHACSAVKKWLERGIVDPAIKLNVTGDITARLNIKRLIEIYRPEIENAVGMIKKQVERGIPGAPQGFNIAKIIEVEIQLVQSLASQLDALEAGAEFKSEGLQLRESLSFTQGSRIGEFLAKQKQIKPTLLKFIPDDCMGLLSLGVEGPTDEIGALYAKLLEAFETDAELQEKILDYFAQVLEMVGNEFAFAMLSSSDGTGGIEIVEIIKVNDLEKAKELFLNLLKEDVLTKWYTNFGMGKPQLEEGTQTYRGVEIQTIIYPSISVQNGPAAAMLRRFYGDKMVMKFAFHQGKMLIAFGKNADTRIQQVIDLINGEGTSIADSDAFKSATAGLSSQEGVVAYLSIPRFIEWIRHIMPIPAGPVTVNITSGVGIHVGIEGSTLKVEQYVPTAEILNIMGAAAQLRQPPQQRQGAGAQQ